MNATERVKHRLRGEPVDRPPNFNIYMTFAAHFIGQPLSHYYLDYRVLAQANQAMVENFAVDLYQAISDPYRETHDLGAQIEFPQDGLPVSKVPLIEEPGDLAKLHPIEPTNGRRMSDRLEAIRLMSQFSQGEYPVMGWVEGALAQAGDLRGAGNLLVDLYDRPDWLHELLELCCEVEIAFARAQVQAGAQIIGLGDALASQISPQMYVQFALPYEQRIFAAVHQAGGLARLHICGNTTRLLPKMVESGADIIDLDWMVDFRAAAQTCGDRLSLCGNPNPVAVMLQGTPEMVYQMTQDCMLAGGPRSFSAAGCEIPDGTPQVNLHAQVKALRDLGDGSGYTL
jgi:uroporphyrinogen decarboxylase